MTLGGDKHYDTAAFVEDLRSLNVTPHVAQNNTHRRSAIDQRTTRHPGYLISQKKRKRVEEIFGWLKTVGRRHQSATDDAFDEPHMMNAVVHLTFSAC